MSKEEAVFFPIQPNALEKAPGLGEYAVKALIPWKTEPVWADIIMESAVTAPKDLQAVNDELQWLWEHFDLAEAQFGENSELFREKNDNLLEGEAPLTVADFQERVILEAIQLKLSNGRVESLQLWYDDGEIFGGASILLEFKDRRLTGIEIRD